MAFTARTETYARNSSLTTPFNFTINKAGGVVDGDIMFMFLAIYVATPPTVYSVPEGWELVATNTTTNSRWYLYYKIASSEGTSYTWSLTASCRYYALNIAYSSGDFSVASLSDITAISNTLYGTAGTTVRAASMSVPAANSPLVYFAAVYNTTVRTFTKPSAPTTDWVEDADEGHITPDLSLTNGSMIWTGSGATGNMDVICSVTITTYKHAFAIALKPVTPPITAGITEAVTGVASESAIFTGLSASAETLNGSDLPTAQYTGLSSVAEASTAIESPSGESLLLSAVLETAIANESIQGAFLLASQASEPSSATEANSSVSVLPSIITEGSTAIDTAVSLFIGLSEISEQAISEDLHNASLVNTVGSSESVNATDSSEVVIITSAVIDEAGILSDLSGSTALFSSIITEEATLADILTGLSILNSVIIEPTAGLDTSDVVISSVTVWSVTIEEMVNVLDLASAIKTVLCSISERSLVAEGGYPRSRIVNQ